MLRFDEKNISNLRQLSITFAPMKQISALWSNSCNCRYPHLSYLFPKRTFSQILQRNGSIKSKFLYTICFFLPLETLNYRRIILANLTTMPNFKDTYSRSSQGNYNTRKGSNVHSIRDLNDTESISKKKHFMNLVIWGKSISNLIIFYLFFTS